MNSTDKQAASSTCGQRFGVMTIYLRQVFLLGLLLMAAGTLAAQQPIRLTGRPVLNVTAPNGAFIDVVYNHKPLAMRLTLKLPNGDTLPCRWKVTETNSQITMPDHKSNIVTLTPQFPGDGGALHLRFFVSFPKGKYIYPIPLREGLAVLDSAGNVIEENVKWVPLNKGKAFVQIDELRYMCIR